jgi:gliding motility-associated-like protein
MKHFLLLSFVIGLLQLRSQSNINADCINAIPLCSTPNFTFNATSGVGTVTDIPSPSNISNPTTNPASGNSGCLLSGELKPQWLLITVGNAGNLEFVFGAGNSANPQVGFYDWAMWPYTAATCAGIQNNTLPPIRCNWNAANNGGTGIASAANIPAGGSAGNYEPPLAVQPCQQYIICISNYSGVNTLVSFQSLGTASLTCNPSCLNVTNPALCAGSSASIVALSSGLQPGITYSINPGGFTSGTPTFVVNPQFNTTYTIYATGLNSSSVAITQTAVSNVTVYPKPVAAPTTTQVTCLTFTNAFDLGLSFVPSSATPAYTVSWSGIPTGVNSPTQTAANGTITPGVYTATISTGNCSTTTGFTLNATPPPATFVLTPPGPTYVINCYSPSINITASNAAFSYTWANGSSGYSVGTGVVFTSSLSGTWTITSYNPLSGCLATKTVVVTVNTVAPSSTVAPLFQNITCNISSIANVTLTSSVPVNITHYVYSSQGATFAANSSTALYTPGTIDNYTYCLVNNVNGCSTCKQFTVTSNQGFPTCSVTCQQNFTLGCASKSLTTVNIIGGNTTPPGGAVSYTALAPGASTVLPPGALTTTAVYSVNAPGTWTFVIKDNTSFCETRVPVTILSNTVGPSLDTVIIPRNVLDCAHLQTTLEAQSETPNVSYNWQFPGPAGNVASNIVVVTANTLAPTNSVLATYTLTVKDNNNACVTATTVPLLQNLFPPLARVNRSAPFISCKTSTVLLTNSSSSQIPPGFPPGFVVGYIWEPPSPQQKLQVSSTYVAAGVGEYTLTALDYGNGCSSQTVISVADGKNYPVLSSSVVPQYPLDCGASSTSITPALSGPFDDLVYQWQVPSGAATGDATKRILTTNKTGNYRVLVTNTLTGCAINAEAGVVNGTLTAAVQVDNQSGFAPLEVNFTNLSASTTGSANITSAWSFGNGSYSVTPSASVSPVVVYNFPGNYTVTISVAKGTCLQSINKVISVEVPSRLEIPNIFTPNGDKINDVFFLKSANLVKISALIYDRWGHKVYDLVSETGNIAWDGKNQAGVDVAEGVYYYIIKATGADGKSFTQKGNVTLVR